MKKSTILFINGIITLILGIGLIAYPPRLIKILGLPPSETLFFQHMLGALLIGISLGLFIEYIFSGMRMRGIGLPGAISINLCGGLILLYWLLNGKLSLTQPGLILLWTLTGLLFGISLLEILILPAEENSGRSFFK